MNVVYVDEQVEPLEVYRWIGGPYVNKHGKIIGDIIYTIRSYRIFNPLAINNVEDLYLVALPDGDKIKCYRSDDKLIEYNSQKHITKGISRRR